MTTIQNTSLIRPMANEGASETTGTAAAALKKSAMDQSDFFELMIAQLKNQDPTKPVDGQQQLAQLAQFTTLQSIQEFQASFESFAKDIKDAIAARATTDAAAGTAATT